MYCIGYWDKGKVVLLRNLSCFPSFETHALSLSFLILGLFLSFFSCPDFLNVLFCFLKKKKRFFSIFPIIHHAWFAFASPFTGFNHAKQCCNDAVLGVSSVTPFFLPSTHQRKVSQILRVLSTFKTKWMGSSSYITTHQSFVLLLQFSLEMKWRAKQRREVYLFVADGSWVEDAEPPPCGFEVTWASWEPEKVHFHSELQELVSTPSVCMVHCYGCIWCLHLPWNGCWN